MSQNLSSTVVRALFISLLAATPLAAQKTGNVEPVRAESTGDAVGDGDTASLDPAHGFDDLQNRDTSNQRDSDGYYVDGGGKRARPVLPQGDWGYGRTPPSSYDRDGSGNTDYVRFETSDARFNAIANFAFNNPGACVAPADHEYAALGLLRVCGPKGSYNATLGMICSMDDVPICH